MKCADRSFSWCEMERFNLDFVLMEIDSIVVKNVWRIADARTVHRRQAVNFVDESMFINISGSGFGSILIPTVAY